MGTNEDGHGGEASGRMGVRRGNESSGVGAAQSKSGARQKTSCGRRRGRIGRGKRIDEGEGRRRIGRRVRRIGIAVVVFAAVAGTGARGRGRTAMISGERTRRVGERVADLVLGHESEEIVRRDSGEQFDQSLGPRAALSRGIRRQSADLWLKGAGSHHGESGVDCRMTPGEGRGNRWRIGQADGWHEERIGRRRGLVAPCDATALLRRHAERGHARRGKHGGVERIVHHRIDRGAADVAEGKGLPMLARPLHVRLEEGRGLGGGRTDARCRRREASLGWAWPRGADGGMPANRGLDGQILQLNLEVRLRRSSQADRRRRRLDGRREIFEETVEGRADLGVSGLEDVMALIVAELR